MMNMRLEFIRSQNNSSAFMFFRLRAYTYSLHFRLIMSLQLIYKNFKISTATWNEILQLLHGVISIHYKLLSKKMMHFMGLWDRALISELNSTREILTLRLLNQKYSKRRKRWMRSLLWWKLIYQWWSRMWKMWSLNCYPQSSKSRRLHINKKKLHVKLKRSRLRAHFGVSPKVA